MGALASINGHRVKSGVDLSRFSTKVQDLFGEFVGDVNLNLGAGRNIEPGFLNLDRKPGPGIDLVMDLEHCALNPGMLPGWTKDEYAWMARDSVDCVLASQVLEHIVHIIPLMREIHRVLKPGGYLCASVPYASSDAAVEDPTHVRYFTERSWHYFDRRLYERPGHAGHYDSDVDFCFDIVAVHLIPYPNVQQAAAVAAQRGDFSALDKWKQDRRNVIQEMIAILQKVEA